MSTFLFSARTASLCRALIAAACLYVLAPQLYAAEPVQFDRDIRPILSDNCFQCHGPDEAARKSGIRLDTKEGLLSPIDDGFVVKPGSPRESRLIERIFSEDPDRRMPPPDTDRAPSKDERELLRKWVDEGAPWSEHWAFIPPKKTLPQKSQHSAWTRNPIDHFIAAALPERGLSPAPEASPNTLLRRVSLDLTGLPPSEEELSAFLADTSADAYENAVDRLLASPRYGERMAWPWLDAARYADTNGYQGDSERTMYPWRDWVVKVFNENMPFDKFTIWQLAGDLLPNATREQKLATAFNRNHMINGEGGRIAEENRAEYVFDQLETVGTVWMGLTFNCCRCHDHKYDPLTNKDYYSLFAFFNQTEVTGEGGDPQTPPNLAIRSFEAEFGLARLKEDIDALATELQSRARQLNPKREAWERDLRFRVAITGFDGSEIAQLLAMPADDLNDEQRQRIDAHFYRLDDAYRETETRLNAAIDKRSSIANQAPRVMIMEDMAEPRKTFILERGLYNKRQEEVTPAVPAALPEMDPGSPRNRLGLARWLVEPHNPLTARVIVNRFWAQVFGQGLVSTTENFGVQGEAPTHPELLDWLAVHFVESGWDVKALMRLMVTSAAYRQSSNITRKHLEVDPQNRFHARGPRYRMPSWMIRDQALFASGLMTPTIGGPPVKPYQPDGIWEEFSFGNIKYERDTGEDLYRRSLYTFWRRIVGPPIFFDSSSRQTCTVKANRTNTPLHALTTLNDPCYVEAARALAGRLLEVPDATDEERIGMAFQALYARTADSAERSILERSLTRLRKQYASDRASAEAFLSVGEWRPHTRLDPIEHAAYAALCLALMNTDEALTKE